MIHSNNKSVYKIFSGLFKAIIIIWSLFPIFWLIVISLRPNLAPLQEGNPFLFKPSLENYFSVIRNREVAHYFVNSLVIGVVATVLSLTFGVSAAYGIARFRFRGQRFCRLWILAIRLLPPIGFVVPLFIMFKTLEMLDSRSTLIIVYTAFLLPFSIWMLTGAIKEISVEAEEAALVDGCNHFQVLLLILIPSLKPTMMAVALLNMIAAWNEFLYALILTSSEAVTLPVAVTGFLGDRGIYWGEITAAAVMIALIPICLLFIIRKNIVKGFEVRLQ